MSEWSDRYRGCGFGMSGVASDAQIIPWQPEVSVSINATPRDELLVYGHQPDPLPPPEQRIGARLTADTRCTQCGRWFLKGHAIMFELKPNMAGTARHYDCNDPKLEREEQP